MSRAGVTDLSFSCVREGRETRSFHDRGPEGDRWTKPVFKERQPQQCTEHNLVAAETRHSFQTGVSKAD